MRHRIRKPSTVRRATRRDLPALVALEQGVFDYDRLSARQYRRHLDSDSALILIGETSRQLAGTAVAFFRSGSDIARLYSIAVAPEARGRGLGEALVAAVERAARRRGCARMRLEVRMDNPAAQRLYERLGYRRIGVRHGYYEDGHGAFRYEKALHPT